MPISRVLLSNSMMSTMWQVIGWGAGIGLLLLLTVALYPSISTAYGDIWKQLPKEWLAFVGAEGSLDTLEGYLNAEFLSYAPLVLSVFAIMAGTGTIAGEESGGTMDFLLSLPVSRVKLAVTKLTAIVLAMAGVVFLLYVFFWIGALSAGLSVEPGRLTNALVLLLPFEVFISLLAVMLSMLFPGRLVAGSLLAVYLVASYILGSLAQLVSWLGPLKPIFVTTYYQGQNALQSEVSWLKIGVLIGLIFLVFAINLVLFDRRDVGVQTGISVSRLLRRKKAVEA